MTRAPGRAAPGDSVVSVADALAQARSLGVDRLDAQLLLAAVLERPRAWLIAHDDAALDEARHAAYRNLLARRVAGEPLAYLLGEKEFHGLALRVDPAVLVPRPDTETLVDWALELLEGPLASLAAPRVVDLGTGSGAIALAIKHRAPRAHVTASELSRDALAVARANSERLGLEIDWREGDWWDAVGTDRFDLALANPPYVAEDDPHLAALRHEPALALAAGPEGLDAIARIVDGAREHLTSGGWLLLEHGYDQSERVAQLLQRAGFTRVQSRADLAGVVRCTRGSVV